MITKFIKDNILVLIALVDSIIGILASVGQVYFNLHKKQENLTYEKQIESLNGVVNSIDTLRFFVVKQKENLTNSQQLWLIRKIVENQQTSAA